MNHLLIETYKTRAWKRMKETGVEQALVECHWIDTWYEIRPDTGSVQDSRERVIFRTREHAGERRS